MLMCVFICVCVCVFVCACVCVCVYIYIYMRIQTCVSMLVCMCVYVYARVCMCVLYELLLQSSKNLNTLREANDSSLCLCEQHFCFWPNSADFCHSSCISEYHAHFKAIHLTFSHVLYHLRQKKFSQSTGVFLFFDWPVGHPLSTVCCQPILGASCLSLVSWCP